MEGGTRGLCFESVLSRAPLLRARGHSKFLCSSFPESFRISPGHSRFCFKAVISKMKTKIQKSSFLEITVCTPAGWQAVVKPGLSLWSDDIKQMAKKRVPFAKYGWEEPVVDLSGWEVSTVPQLATQSLHRYLTAQPNFTVTPGTGRKRRHCF